MTESSTEWTVDTLKVHFDELRRGDQKALEAALQAAQKAVDAALQAAEKAVVKAETAAEKRFESVNEFRATLADQQKTLVSRNEWSSSNVTLTEKINKLENWQSAQAGASDKGRSSSTMTLIIVGLLISGSFSTITLILRLTGH